MAEKKVWDQPAVIRSKWISAQDTLPIVRQCELISVSRSSFYADAAGKAMRDTDHELCQRIDEKYTQHPFYGSRRMVVHLKELGRAVNRKRVQRLMRQMGLAGMAPGPNTSQPHPEHKVFPYRLRGVAVVRPNQVWSTDITYIRLARGFAYLVAIIDWYSRKVLSWRLSNSMDASFCVDCLDDALRRYGKPGIFNSDQGSQFTSTAFIGVLEREQITISMDGRGRALDNIFVERLWRTVKYEDVYLKGYGDLCSLTLGLTEYFAFYNEARPHQSLDNQTPARVYQTGKGGGAMIVDKYSIRPKAADSEKTGQRCSAADEEVATA